MLVDGVRFGEAMGGNTRRRAVASFIDFIERRLGVTTLYDRRRVPFGRLDLAEPFEIAAMLMEHGVIDWWLPSSGEMPDEPPMRFWTCGIAGRERERSAGASVDDDASALYAAFAEGLERYLWWTQRDCFVRPIHGTSREIASRARILAPERFASFSQTQRENSPALRLSPDASYVWIEGMSLVSGKRTYVPAQTASAAHRPFSSSPREPLIRTQNTTGLATWPTLSGARLSGALECIERDAYMIMWFNQLTLPRAKLATLRKRSEPLDALVARCERYGLRAHIVPLLTDAPTWAVFAIVEDESAEGPRFAFGMKADCSLARAAERALLEALRARRFARASDPSEYDSSKPVDEIGHHGRVHYWRLPEHASHLEFLVAGEEKEFPEAAWERDSAEQHLERILRWCRERGYECVSVPLGTSKANPTPWQVEMVLMPDLIWMHLTENLRHLGGKRLKSVPERFGYKPRGTPFIERPHPFC